jgi:sulfur carrier protein
VAPPPSAVKEGTSANHDPAEGDWATESIAVQITVNGETRRSDDGLTVARLLDELRLADSHVAVEVNLELIPRADHAAHRLADGDRLEIVTLVGGG